jgi:hypothetical protein
VLLGQERKKGFWIGMEEEWRRVGCTFWVCADPRASRAASPHSKASVRTFLTTLACAFLFLLLRTMDSDRPTDGHTNSTTPDGSELLSTLPMPSLPEKTLQALYNRLNSYYLHANEDEGEDKDKDGNGDEDEDEDEDKDKDDKQIFLGFIWAAVNNTLKKDTNLEEHLANQEEYRGNIEKGGEEQFIDLLKDMVRKKDWRDIVTNSVSFLSSLLKCCDHVLSPGVFYRQPEPEWSMALASRTGAQSSHIRCMFCSLLLFIL